MAGLKTAIEKYLGEEYGVIIIKSIFIKWLYSLVNVYAMKKLKDVEIIDVLSEFISFKSLIYYMIVPIYDSILNINDRTV